MICRPNNPMHPLFQSNDFVSGNYIPPRRDMRNNPEFDDVRYHGPIPMGEYTIGPQRPNSTRRNLIPSPANDMHDRNRFQTHLCPKSDSCSAGCVAASAETIDTFNRLMSAEEGDNILHVVP